MRGLPWPYQGAEIDLRRVAELVGGVGVRADILRESEEAKVP